MLLRCSHALTPELKVPYGAMRHIWMYDIKTEQPGGSGDVYGKTVTSKMMLRVSEESWRWKSYNNCRQIDPDSFIGHLYFIPHTLGWQKKCFLNRKCFTCLSEPMNYSVTKLCREVSAHNCPINLSERRYTCSKWTSFFTERRAMLLIM